MRAFQFLCFPVLISLSSWATPQAPAVLSYVDLEIVDSNTIDWPAGIGGAGPFQRAVVGRITGHDEISAIVTKGGIATLVYRPTHFNALSELSMVPFTDVAILEDNDLDDQDGVICAGPSGLVRFEFNPQTQSFTSQTLAGIKWANALRLEGVELNGTGSPEVIGLSASGKEALILYWDETLGLSGQTTFPLGTNCHDITALDWNNDGTMEIAVFHGAKMEVYPLSGGPSIANVRVLTPGGAFAPLVNNNGPDHLGLVLRNPPDTQDWLYTFNSTGYQGPLNLQFVPPNGGAPAPINLNEAQSGDWDGDGDLDLLFTHEQFHQAIVMDNTGSASSPVFDLEDTLELDLSPTPHLPATGNKGVASFKDLDRDPQQTADMIFPLDSTQGLVIKTATPKIEYFTMGGVPVWEFFHEDSVYVQTPTEGQLDLYLTSVPDELTSEYPYIQVAIWQQTDPLTPAEPPATNRVGIYNEIHLLHQDPLAEGNHIVHVNIPMTTIQTEACPDGGFVWPGRDHLYVLMRFAKAVPWGSNYRVTEGAYPLAIGMTLPSNAAEKANETPSTNPAYEYLTDIGINDILIPLLDDANSRNAGVGAIIPQMAIPPFMSPGIPDPSPLRMAGQGTSPW